MKMPNSRQTFKDLILRNNGAPVLDLQIDDEQIEDKIDEAIKYYRDYNADGSERIYMKHKITQIDIDREYIEIPELVHAVLGIWDLNISSASNSIFGARYQLALNDFFNLTSTSLLSYQNTMSYLSMVEDVFASRPSIAFNRHINKLYIHMDWKKSALIDKYIIVECYRVLDPEVYTDMWNDRLLINHATSLVKLQIATHLKLFNITLTGNVSYNGDAMYSEALNEIQRIEDNYISSYSMPAMDIIG